MRQKDRFLLLLVLASLPIGRMAAEELESTSPSPIRQEIRQSSVRITGTVVDVQGEPIIGASVVEKGTSNNGVITDVDGNFVLNVSPGSTLQISYVGYGTQEIVIGSQRSFNIVMKEDTELLDEVVVMAYNTTVKRKLTNAVTTVDTEQISDLAAYSSVSQAIQGRAPGVYISNSTGMPGSTPSLKIRGNDAPLYVIDGIVQDAETFNRLNSQDIENLSFG